MHSCGSASVADHLAGASPNVAATYAAFVEALARIGEAEAHPAKTRIGFCNRMTFAAVWFRKRFLGGHLILDEPPDSPRFRRGELPIVHRFELRRPEDVDDDFVRWMRRAFQRGMKH
jgi:hypothetical protein